MNSVGDWCPLCGRDAQPPCPLCPGYPHEFVRESSAESPYCGSLILRDGCGETCGKRRNDPVHHADLGVFHDRQMPVRSELSTAQAPSGNAGSGEAS